MSQLRVRNVRQKILFEEEISGQISDGMWENATPHDHWKPWCDADVVVAEDGNVGRTFWARRNGYMITSKELLDIVGDRMVEYVRDASTRDHSETKELPEFPGYNRKQMMADLKDLREIMRRVVTETTPTPYPSNADRRAAWQRYHQMVKDFKKPYQRVIDDKVRELVVPPKFTATDITEAYIKDPAAARREIEGAMNAVAFS